MRKILIPIFYSIGWFLDKILFNLFLLVVYPVIFLSCWTVGYFSLIDRRFKSWFKYEPFPVNFYREGSGVVISILSAGMFVGLICLFVWKPIILIYLASILIIFIILICSIYVYSEKERKRIEAANSNSKNNDY